MDGLFRDLLPLLGGIWWPFCRLMAGFSAAPVFGDNMVPVRVRILLALVLAVVALPSSHHATAVDPFSLTGVALAFEQVVVGLLFGMAFQLSMAAILLLGYLASSQIGLSLAVMNDPMSGASSDVVSYLLYIASILTFFAIDGHLVLTQVLYASFDAWPVGRGLAPLSLQMVAHAVAWVFSAALLLALPVVFSTLVVQIGFGFFNRVAPSLNLYSLGFSLVTLFGIMVLGIMVRAVPGQYVQLTERVLELLQRLMQAGAHG